MGRILVLDGCYKCWYKVWGKCFNPDLKKEQKVCPEKGFRKDCPLSTEKEFYEGVKTAQYCEDNDW